MQNDCVKAKKVVSMLIGCRATRIADRIGGWKDISYVCMHAYNFIITYKYIYAYICTYCIYGHLHHTLIYLHKICAACRYPANRLSDCLNFSAYGLAVRRPLCLYNCPVRLLASQPVNTTQHNSLTYHIKVELALAEM